MNSISNIIRIETTSINNILNAIFRRFRILGNIVYINKLINE